MTPEELSKHLSEAHAEIRKLSNSTELKKIDQSLALMRDLELVKVTAESLRESGLNTILNELRKGSNAELAIGAKKLVTAFRATLTAAASPTSPLATPVASSNPETIPTPTKRSRDPDSISKSISPTSSKDSSSTLRPKSSFTLQMTGDTFRDNMQGRMHEYLGPDEFSSDGGVFRVELTVRLERAIFEAFGRDSKSSDYRARCRTVLSNLKDPKNPFLNERLYNGACDPETLATMSEIDMASDEMKKRREQDEEYMLALRKTDTDMGAKGTDMFTCPKCRKSNCNFYQKQTRSADEPMTTFITCLECKNKWRQY